MISQESLSWVIQSGAHFWHLDVLMLLLLRDAFWYVGWIQLWIWVIGITHLMTDYLMLFDFRLIPHLIPYWGIFSFWLRFIDLHGVACLSPLMRCTSRWWRVHYFIMILQWSLSGSIQPGPHFSAFGCHHAYYSKRHFIDVWVWFGLRRSRIWWWMISCHPISDLSYI